MAATNSVAVIRMAEINDGDAIYKMMEDIAFSNFGMESKIISRKEMEEAFFGSNSFVRCLVAETEGTIGGFVLYYFTYSTWVGPCVGMQYLYVVPDYRKRGIAEALLRKLAKVACETGCARLSTFVGNGSPTECLLLRSGFTDVTKLEDWHLYTMPEDKMKEFSRTPSNLSNSIMIRKAASSDCLNIHAMINDLAVYEKMQDQFKISPLDLESDGFNNINPYYCSFVAERDGEMLGYTLFFPFFTILGVGIHMEDLYVAPSARASGIGTALWQAVVKFALERGYKMCGFSVLGWNKPSIDFYKKKGCSDLTVANRLHMVRIVGEDLKKFSE